MVSLTRLGAEPALTDAKTQTLGVDNTTTKARAASICAATGLSLSIEDLAASDAFVGEWRDLADRALEANLFYEADFAQAAAMAFGQGVKIVLIRNKDGRLVLAWPFRLKRARWGIPLAVMLGWGHPFAALGLPLVDADFAESAIEALLRIDSTLPHLPPRLLFPQVRMDGAFAQALAKLHGRNNRRMARLEQFDRAHWRLGERDDPFETLSSGSKSKLRQELRRLEKQGPITLDVATEPADVEKALEDYCMLEATGWKGRAGTAVTQSEAEMQLMRLSCIRYARAGRVRIHTLRLDGEPIASSVTFISGRHAWYDKISFNDKHAKNSPGSQLVLKVTELLRTEGEIDTVDACAPPGHPLMKRFWPLRYEVSNLLVETEKGDGLYALALGLESARPKVRDFVRKTQANVRKRLSRGAAAA